MSGGLLTRRGGTWQVSTVMTVDRLGLREAEYASPG